MCCNHSSHIKEKSAEIEKLLPKLEVKYFTLDEMNNAWDWIQE
ncbi:STAS/SEC14 domain-containing protein [Planococcus faecalis]